MNKINKLILALFVSGVFNDINAMESSLLLAIKEKFEKRQNEIKRINKLLKFTEKNPSDISFNIINPIDNIYGGYERQAQLIIKNKNKFVLINDLTQSSTFFDNSFIAHIHYMDYPKKNTVIGQSKNLLAWECSPVVSIFKKKLTSNCKEQLTLLVQYLQLPCKSYPYIISVEHSVEGRYYDEFAKDSACTFTNNNFLICQKFNLQAPNEHFIELWDCNDINNNDEKEAKFIKKLVLNTNFIVKPKILAMVKEKNDKYFIKIGVAKAKGYFVFMIDHALIKTIDNTLPEHIKIFDIDDVSANKELTKLVRIKPVD